MTAACTKIMDMFKCDREMAIRAINESEAMHGNHLEGYRIGYLIRSLIDK